MDIWVHSETNKVGNQDAAGEPLLPPRQPPRSKVNTVTFDTSSVNSSPKSRSSREKEEEGFRSDVAQSLSLGSKDKSSKLEPAEYCGMDESPERSGITQPTRLEDVEKSLDSPVIADYPKPPPAYSLPTYDQGSPRDGMEEYASHYQDPSGNIGPYDEKTTTSTGLPDEKRQGAYVDKFAKTDLSAASALNRQELKDPDGASGPSSPKTDPQHSTATDICEQDKKSKHPKSAKYHSGIEESLIPPEQKMEREPDVSKSPKTEVTEVPDTNIAVAFLVTLCFNLPLGVLAIYFSLMATKAYRDGQNKKGAKKAKISIYISLFSIVLTVLVVMAVVLYLAITGQSRQRRFTTKTSINL